MTPVIRTGPSGHQTSRDPLCQMLRKVLVDGAQAGRGAAGGGSGRFRSGRAPRCTSYCWSIRLISGVGAGPAAGLGRFSGRGGASARCTARRLCAYVSLMRCCCWICWTTSEGRPPRHRPLRPDRHPPVIHDDTDALPAIAADPPTQPATADPGRPALSPHRSAGAGRPDPDHGGAGDDPPRWPPVPPWPTRPQSKVTVPPMWGTGGQRRCGVDVARAPGSGGTGQG